MTIQVLDANRNVVTTSSVSDLIDFQKSGQELLALIRREGDPVSWTSFNPTAVSVATGAQNVSIATAQGLPVIGKMTVIEEITVSLSSPGIAQVQIPASADGLFPGFLKQVIVGASPVSFRINQAVRAINFASSSNISLSVRNNLTAGSVDYFGAISASGYRLADDADFGADKKILFIGDSILNGTAGPTKTALQWPFVFKEFLTNQGVRSRVIVKSVSGSTTSQHEGMRSAGWHDIQDVDLGIYAVSVNDAGASVSDGAYTSNLASFWNWWSKRYPQTPLIICGTTPLSNNTSEARAAGLRNAASTYVSSVGSKYLKFVNFGSAFDRTNLTNYTNLDGIHLNDTTHPIVGNALISAYPSLDITL